MAGGRLCKIKVPLALSCPVAPNPYESKSTILQSNLQSENTVLIPLLSALMHLSGGH